MKNARAIISAVGTCAFLSSVSATETGEKVVNTRKNERTIPSN
jgi:Ni,Fe-hydrogenase I small subunit